MDLWSAAVKYLNAVDKALNHKQIEVSAILL